MASKHVNSPSPSPSLRSAEEGSPQRPTKRAKGAPGILASHRIFILQAKLSHTEISEIFDLAEKADADVVSSPDEADIVITAIGMRKRLERHLDWNLAVSCRICQTVYSAFDQPGNDDHNPQKRKALVTPDWLRDSVAQARPLPCADYAALPDLKATNEKVCRRGGSLPSEKPLSKFKSRSPSLQDISLHSRSSYRATHEDIVPPAFLLPPPVPPPPAELDHTARYCCSRASPLVCVNQPLCAALDVLRRSRALESNEHSALSYARAIAVSIALPSFISLPLNFHASQAIKGAFVCVLQPAHIRLLGSQRFRERSRPGSAGKYRNYLSLGQRSPRWYASRHWTCIHLLIPADRRIPLSWANT